MNPAFVPRISWTFIVHLFLGEAFTQKAPNCWAVGFVRNLQFVRKMMKWLGTQPSINVAKILSIQELINSMPRRSYDEHGVVHPLLDNEVGILDAYALANHFRESGTVYEEDCPITEQQVFLDESTTTEGCERIIPNICAVHYIYDYLVKYGEDGISIFHRELEKQLREGGALSIQFEVYPSYNPTQGNLYFPSNAEQEFNPLGEHCVLATALGTLDGFLALECQDSRGPTWGSSGYIYVALDMVGFFFVIR